MAYSLPIIKLSNEFFLRGYLCKSKKILENEEDKVELTKSLNWLVKNEEYVKLGRVICEYSYKGNREGVKAPMDGVLRIYENLDNEASSNDSPIATISFCHHFRMVKNVCQYCKSPNVQTIANTYAIYLQENILDVLKVKKMKDERNISSNKRPPTTNLESLENRKKFCIYDVLPKNLKDVMQTAPKVLYIREEAGSRTEEGFGEDHERNRGTKKIEEPPARELPLFFKGDLDPSTVNFYFKIVAWHCKIGSKAKRGDKLGTLEIYDENLSLFYSVEIACQHSGRIYYIAELNKVTQGDEIIYCQNFCQHKVVYNQICTDCNDKLTNTEIDKGEFKPVMAATHNHLLKFSKEEQRKFDEEISNRLLDNRKLLLMLDLDNTLVHAIFCDKLVGHDTSAEDIFECEHGQLQKFVVKIRPHLDEFFYKIYNIYDFYIYTKGNRNYAERVVENLEVYFKKKGKNIKIPKEKLITADEYKNQKSIRLVLPETDHMHLILDDLPAVWQETDQINIVYTKPFWYWDEAHNKQVNEEIKGKYESGEIKKVRENEFSLKVRRKFDNFLHYAAILLQNIHQKFFEIYDEEGDANVSEIYNILKNPILSGEKIAFSGIFEKSENPAENKNGARVLQYGGELAINPEDASCIVTKKFFRSKKINTALKLKKPIVHIKWLHFSELYFQKLEYEPFVLGPEKESLSDTENDLIDEHLYKLINEAKLKESNIKN